MNSSKKVLQIVPKTPGQHDGVGDYALTLATKLQTTHGVTTVFAAADFSPSRRVAGFEVLPLEALAVDESPASECDHVVLHYVSYGYQKRGVPFALLPMLSRLRQNCRGSWVTVFHEFYASAPPWRSAFWLRPFQIHVARSIARLSDVAVVSSEAIRAEVKRLRSDLATRVHPVISNFGEPALAPDQLTQRDPGRWVICGGTALVEQSLRSFRAVLHQIPPAFFPRELLLIGGIDNPAVRGLMATLKDLPCQYYPAIEVAEASRLLATCSFLWLDYFHRPDAPTSAILKSTAFAAACAHGVIPVLPHPGSAISIEGDRLPGPFFIASNAAELPPTNGRAGIEFFNWYQRRASSDLLARGIADALGLSNRSS